MIYRDFQDLKLSGLGMGAMRLPVIDGDDNRIDTAKAEEMVAFAMEHGINYYDTAWGYHGGQSEIVMGNALKKYPRDKFIWRQNSRGMIFPISGKWKRFLRSSLKNARWSILISICSTMSAR